MTRPLAVGLALLLVAGLLSVEQSRPALAQESGLSFAKAADAQVLAGDGVGYSLTASNPSDGNPLFNVSFRDVLPPGTTYEPGSTQPPSAGEPRIITAPVTLPDGTTTDQQTLIWDNVSDLPAGGSVTLSFNAEVPYAEDDGDLDSDGYRVGSDLENVGEASASENPRFIPRTNAAGEFDDSRDAVVVSNADDAVTTVSALDLAKAEPSPSGRLLRGLAQQWTTYTTTYTLTVTNNGIAETSGVVVVDRLPAQLEFLGCDEITLPEEYPGAPTPTLPAFDPCLTPETVETIEVDGEVFTEVTWNLGDLAPGEVVEIEYRAAIPLLANTMDWGNGAPPSAGDQDTGHGNDLGNNTGASTRELTAASQSVTNEVVATGTYTGPVVAEADRDAVAEDDITRVVADVRIQKSVAPGSFEQGETVTYTLTIDVSQYVDASGIVVTDVIPDGLCPVVNSNDALAGQVPSECVDSANLSAPVNASFDSIADADGEFTIVFGGIADIPANGTVNITYTALAREAYDGISAPTVAGDGFTNTADLEATTTPIDADTGESGDEELTDTAAATVTTDAESLFKRVLPRPATSDGSCPTEGYVDQYPPGTAPFREGDRVCFEVEARFSGGVDTRNAILTDFLPTQVAYESSTVIVDPCGGDLSDPGVTPCVGVEAEADPDGDVVAYELGELIGDDRFVPPGAVFVVHIAGTIRDVPVGLDVDLTANLAKLNSANTDGAVRSQRAEIEVPVAPVPNLGIVKGVANVDRDGTNLSTDGLPNLPPDAPENIDGVEVRQGDVVTYRIDLDNDGANESEADAPVTSVQFWDLLPDGIVCADVSDITDDGECTDPGDAGHPSASTGGDRSIIVWDLDDSSPQLQLEPQERLSVTYDVTIPSGAAAGDFFPPAASSTLPNDAYVRSFTSPSNLSVDDPGTDDPEFFPQNNIDETVGSGSWNAQELTDPSEVSLPDAELDKQVVATSQQGDENNDLTNAVNGEEVTYDIELRLPAGSTVYDARLTEALPPGLTPVTAGAYVLTYFPDADATGPGDEDVLPTGVSFDDTDGTITWDGQYDVGNTDELFVLTVRVTVDADTDLGDLDNTATFTFFDRPDGIDGRTQVTEDADATVEVIAPDPSLTKANDADGDVVGGDSVGYTVTVSNDAGAPPLHDAVVTDCLPEGLVFDGFTGPVDGDDNLLYAPQTAQPGSCETGETELTWDVGTVEPGQSIDLTYTVTVRDDAVAGRVETNRVSLIGSSLNDDANDLDNELVLELDDDSSVTIAGAEVTKSVDPAEATIGEEVTFTVTATLPPNVNFFNLSVLDRLPAGLDPDVTLDSVTCAPVGPDCDAITASPTSLTDAADGDATLIGWLFGDVNESDDSRTLTLAYATAVDDLVGGDPVRGDELVNAARPAWDLSTGDAPSSADEGFDVEPDGDSATVTVLEPELGTAKAVDVGADRAAGRPEPGDTFTYTVTVTNVDQTNASDAYNLVVSDVVPTGVVVDTGTISHGGVFVPDTDDPAVAGTITWTFDPDDAADPLNGPLAPGASIQLIYDATLAPSAGLTSATLTNTASVDGYESLPEDGREYTGPQDTAEVTPTFPDLSLTKSLPDGPLTYIGDELVWQLQIANASDAGRAFALEVTDDLPPNWTYVPGSAIVGGVTGAAADPAVSTAAGVQTLTWSSTQLGDLDLDELAPGATLTITYRAVPSTDVVDDPGVGSGVGHPNDATVTGEDRSGASENADGPYTDADDESARIDAADLRLTKSGAASAVAGEDHTWDLVVTNDGPDTAVGPFAVTDTLPEGVDFVSASGIGWDCGVPDPDRVLTCTRTNAGDTLANEASFPAIGVTVAIPADTAAGTALTNRADVGARTYDPDPDNNEDEDTVSVATAADLAITKQLSGDLVAGADATYTMIVQNLGPSLSEGPITVTDDVPEGTAFVSADGDGWDCDEVDGAVTCTRSADLAVGQVAPQIVLVVAVDSDRTDDVVNNASVEGTTPDPNDDNDDDTVTTTPTLSADLGIEKALQDEEIVAGVDATYRLTVTNFGPSDAVGVVVTDDVPNGMRFVSGSGDGWTCGPDDAQPGETVTCTLDGPLAAGGQTSIDLVFSTSSDPADLDDPVTNTAVVDSDTPDPNPSNNESTDDNSVTGEADLSIVKTHEGPVLAGEEVTFDLVVANAGPSDAAAPVTITDVLPDGMAFVSVTGDGWNCVHDDGTVTCTLVDADAEPVSLTAGATAPALRITVQVDPSAGPVTLTNIASVDSPTSDPNPGNNTETDEVEVRTEADLALTKTTVGDNPVIAGEETSFEVQVTNRGPSTATSVSVVDQLPSGVELVSASGAGWDCSQTASLTLRCDRGTLLPGVAPPITVQVRVLGAVEAGAVLTNVATVSSATPDPNPGDNTDDSAVTVDAEADLVLTKTGPDAAPAGSHVEFDLALTNRGPSDAIAPITIVDQLPPGMTFVSATGPWSCDPGEVTGTGQQVTCLLDGGTSPLAADATAPTLTLRVLIDPAADGGTLTNVASATSPTVDPDPEAATDTDDVEVTPLANVRITKSHAGPVRVGDSLIFTLDIRNDGPSEARDVQVVDVVPDELPVQGVAGDGWSCDVEGQQVTCDLDEPLPPGTAAAPIELEVLVTADAYPSIDNVATVTTSTEETTEEDNTTTDTVEVPAQVDLTIEKSHRGSFIVGQEGTFDLVISNLGPTPDPGPITVVDELPAGLTPRTASGTGWDCDIDGQSVTCVRDAGLDVDESTELSIVVEIGPEAAPSVVNEASVSSDAEDVDPSNNRDDDLVSVTPVSNLTVEKEAVAEEDGQLTWEITVGNDGPNATSEPIVAVDELVGELSFASASGDGWTCVEDGQVVTCTFGRSLAVGATTVLTLVTAVAADPGTTITNTVVVEGGSAAAVTTTATASVDVGELAKTGVTLSWLLLAAMALLAGGGGLLARHRRLSG